MTVHSDIDTAIIVFEECVNRGTSDIDSMWAAYCYLTSGILPEPEIIISHTVLELKKYIPDTRVYDKFIPAGA